MPTTLIPTVGRTPDSRWCGPRRSTKPDDSNNTAEPGSTAAQNYLKDCSTHRGRTAQPLDFLETYEMNISSDRFS